jgi:hypothetical protein
MKKIVLFSLLCAAVVGIALAADGSPAASPDSGAGLAMTLPHSTLFDGLGKEPDVVYLIANSSVIFGPDPHGRSEELTFVGPVTVPKWPMKGYGRRVLPDGRQQIDIELTQSELTGESYVLGGPVVLGEHPDLRSLGTITERPAARGVALVANKTTDKKSPAKDAKKPATTKSTTTSTTTTSSSTAPGNTVAPAAPTEEVPADFVVERKVLLTTAKGILYNETAVPVRGRIDSIPPVKFQGTPVGVNTFRGMELPVALLDREGNVNGWFYSKAHMAYAVKPAALERAFVKGRVALSAGGKSEEVEVSGPAEIHHLTAPGSASSTEMEVMVLALRGHSELLGGDIMVAETFSDRDHFSRGQLAWQGNNADSKFDLFVDIYTPSTKLTTHEPLAVSGKLTDCQVNGHLEKGKLNLAMMGGKGHFASSAARTLYNEAEKPVVNVVKLELDLAERM